jgi:hypothetical protein
LTYDGGVHCWQHPGVLEEARCPPQTDLSEFPHANQKAERSVGSAKRVIRDAVKPNVELDPVALVKVLLTMRNTPDRDTGMSPAQMFLGR